MFKKKPINELADKIEKSIAELNADSHFNSWTVKDLVSKQVEKRIQELVRIRLTDEFINEKVEEVLSNRDLKNRFLHYLADTLLNNFDFKQKIDEHFRQKLIGLLENLRSS